MSVTSLLRQQRSRGPQSRGGQDFAAQSEDIARGGSKEAGASDPTKTLKTSLETLADYFPAEVLALYIFVLSVADNLPASIAGLPQWGYGIVLGVIMCLFLAVTDTFIAKRTSGVLEIPYWPVFASVTAFVIWALAMPHGGPPVSAAGAASLVDPSHPIVVVVDEVASGIGARLAPLLYNTALWGVMAIVWSMVLVRLGQVFGPGEG